MVRLPTPWARYYLENPPSLVVLLVLNLVGVLVGIRFYVESMPDVHTLLWPLYLDSAVALALMTVSLMVPVTILGRSLEAAPQHHVLAVIHTLAFVWLVKYGLWTAAVLTIGIEHYGPSVTEYWFIVLTHLAFLLEALLIPHYGRTSGPALGLALVAVLLNDAIDYGLGYHPPLRYEPGLGVVVLTIGLSVGAVVLAHRSLDRLEAPPDRTDSNGDRHRIDGQSAR